MELFPVNVRLSLYYSRRRASSLINVLTGLETYLLCTLHNRSLFNRTVTKMNTQTAEDEHIRFAFCVALTNKWLNRWRTCVGKYCASMYETRTTMDLGRQTMTSHRASDDQSVVLTSYAITSIQLEASGNRQSRAICSGWTRPRVHT